MFLGLPDPDPLVKSTDPALDPAPDPPSSNKNSNKKPLFLEFYDFFYDFLSLKNDVNVPVFYFWASRIRIRIRSHKYGSGSFHHQANIVRKTLISTVFLLLLYDFLSLKNDVNVPVFRIRMIRMFSGLPYPHPDPLVRDTGTDPRIRIRIRIRTIPKYHGSATLL
jgi:hypothetical protein